jgi:hypothetical protein
VPRTVRPSRAALASRPSAALLAAALLGLAAAGARADVEDLTPTTRRGDLRPPTFVLRAEGGSGFSPYGYTGACLSYYNDLTGAEFEGGAGAGFPGLQLGLSVRKLIGFEGDFLVTELAVAYNSQALRGTAQQNGLAGGSHSWFNLGFGFEHRAGFLSLSASAGISLPGFTQTPQGYVHGGVGFGL